MRRLRLAILVLLAGVLLSQPASVGVRPERLPQDTGATGLNQALKKLKTTARMLQTTAHPDDEDGGMLAYESRGQGAEVMLLTLTRGDGGQNKTGSNLFDELGVLRTLELLESDRYYGVQQRFSRVADFGYTKNPEETFQKWGGHDVALADMVRVIRAFQPDVVASGWSGTPRDGHGQHQAAGILSPEAVHAAADPERFPDQIKDGLLPWPVKKFYVRSREDSSLRLEAGKVDPNLGTSYAQFGIEGYSHQKSQNASVFPVRPGPNYRNYKLIESGLPASQAPAGEEKDFFDGLDTSLPGLAAKVGAEQAKVPFLRDALKQVDVKVDEAIASHSPEPLLVAWNKLQEIISRVENSGLSRAARRDLLLRLQTKSEQFEEAAQLALGISLHVLRPAPETSPMIVPGQTFRLIAKFDNRGRQSVDLNQVSLILPSGWKQPAATSATRTVRPGESVTAEFMVSVPENAELTRPYWRRIEPDRESIHTIVDSEYVTLPYPPPPIKARAQYRAAGASGEIGAIAQAQSNGKLAPLAVVPAFSLLMQHASQIVPVGRTSAMNADVLVRSNLEMATTPTVRLSAPPGWKVEPASQQVSLSHAGDEKVLPFTVLPTASSEKNHQLKAELQWGGKNYGEGFSVVTREDLDTFYYYQPAIQKTYGVRVELPKQLRVGYVMGAGDEILPVLQQLGLNAGLISAPELATGGLKQFDTIVLGIRAYDTRDDLRTYNQRLLEFVNQGGTLVVQNNFDVEAFNAGNFAPFPLQLSRQRVSVEEAPVEILVPGDSVFTYPNRITKSDFEGWIQERGVNFMAQWDEKYLPLLASGDPGEVSLKGGLLRATVGKGTYIYTGYAFFRQLPAGVPGAIRLYVNLLAAGHQP